MENRKANAGAQTMATVTDRTEIPEAPWVVPAFVNHAHASFERASDATVSGPRRASHFAGVGRDDPFPSG